MGLPAPPNPLQRPCAGLTEGPSMRGQSRHGPLLWPPAWPCAPPPAFCPVALVNPMTSRLPGGADRGLLVAGLATRGLWLRSLVAPPQHSCGPCVPHAPVPLTIRLARPNTTIKPPLLVTWMVFCEEIQFDSIFSKKYSFCHLFFDPFSVPQWAPFKHFGTSQC